MYVHYKDSKENIWNNQRYSHPPLSMGDIFKDLQWMLETTGSNKPYIYYVYFLYIHTYL